MLRKRRPGGQPRGRKTVLAVGPPPGGMPAQRALLDSNIHQVADSNLGLPADDNTQRFIVLCICRDKTVG
jgi:hypothetical protein